jgi:acetyl esterase/lipase
MLAAIGSIRPKLAFSAFRLADVRPGCPPMFLAQASDDDISDRANTQILTEACKRADVAVEFHLLPSGGHGFGMGKAGSPTEEWPRWFEAWLRRNRMLT